MIHIYSNHQAPGIKRSHTHTRQFSVISTKQQVIVCITISADMHMDKMNCSPSQITPYIKLFFVGHIIMTEFVIMGQSVNLFMNYLKKESQQPVILDQILDQIIKNGSEPEFQPSSNNTVYIYMDYYTLACFKNPLTLICIVLCTCINVRQINLHDYLSQNYSQNLHLCTNNFSIVYLFNVLCFLIMFFILIVIFIILSKWLCIII